MTSRPSLVIIGAGYLQLPLVEKAQKRGIETHVFAWEEGAVARHVADHFYPISITDAEEILAVARQIRPDGVASIASDLAMVAVNHIAAELGLIGNSVACTAATTHKLRMRAALRDAGLPGPAFLSVPDGSFDGRPPFPLPVIVKPADRSGSRGVSRVDDAADLQWAIDHARQASFGGSVIVEELLIGREISVEMISWQGEHHALACTDKETTGPPGFVETGHHQPAELSSALRAQIYEVVRRSLDALDVDYGASHSELRITDDDELGIVEIAARMGGDFIGSDLVPLSTGYDFLGGVIDVALGAFSPPVLSAHRHAGVRFVAPDHPGAVGQIVDRTAAFSEIVRSEVQVQVGDVVGPVRQSADRCGYFLYQSDHERFTAPIDQVLSLVLQA